MNEWEEDCLKWRGVVLTGVFSHWCNDWDGLPIDETCREFPCACMNRCPCGSILDYQYANLGKCRNCGCWEHLW